MRDGHNGKGKRKREEKESGKRVRCIEGESVSQSREKSQGCVEKSGERGTQVPKTYEEH